MRKFVINWLLALAAVTASVSGVYLWTHPATAAGALWEASDPFCESRSGFCAALIPGTRTEVDVWWDHTSVSAGWQTRGR